MTRKQIVERLKYIADYLDGKKDGNAMADMLDTFGCSLFLESIAVMAPRGHIGNYIPAAFFTGEPSPDPVTAMDMKPIRKVKG